jgi:hypothetical protein
MIDLAPRFSGWFFLCGLPACLVATMFLKLRYIKAAGKKAGEGRSSLFWIGGTVLIVACLAAIPKAMPAIRGQYIGQLAVVMVGIFYFLGGVHYDRNFLWLGPALCACGLLVGLLPHYGWTALGVVFALGLVVPTLVPPRPPENIQQPISA